MKNKILLLLFFFNCFLNAQTFVPDPSFATSGFLVTNFNMYYDNDQAPTNVHFENNNYIFCQKTQLSRVSYNGVPDYSFGTDGFTRIIIPDCPNCPVIIKNSKIINNSIFVFGKVQNGTSISLHGFIAKMSLDGILDPAFGNNGIVTVTIGNLYSNDPYSKGISDIVYKNGNYFAIGSFLYNDTASVIRRSVFAVKLDNNGVIDLSFDSSGLKKFTSVDGNSAEAIYDYDDGLLIIGNISNNNTTSESSATFLKMDENGVLDPAFGNNGLKKIVYADGLCSCQYIMTETRLEGNDLYYLLSYASSASSNKKIQKIDISTLQGVNTANSLVTNQITFMGNPYSVGKYVIDNDKIYILECTDSNTNNDFNVTRRNMDGTLDTTFNQTGTYSFSFPPPISALITYDTPSVLLKHADGRIFVGGYSGTQFFPGANIGFAMLRVRDQTLANDEAVKNYFTLSPNPVEAVLNIGNPDAVTIEKITVLDTLGKIVYESDGTVASINLEDLKTGLYFVRIHHDNTIESFKIIKSQ